jgi:hypothetical protein
MAPIRGLLPRSDAIGTIVRHALERAGVEAPHRGSHQFRHALAVRMLQRGASLTEIGEVLRHQSPPTTSIYARVDIGALRPLAQPWPGGARCTPCDSGSQVRPVPSGAPSTYAHNIEIVAVDGNVTLNGVVRNQQERESIQAKAHPFVTNGSLVNNLKIAP